MLAMALLTIALASSAPYVPDGSGPPDGTAEDQQLWRDLQAGTADAFAAIGRVTQGAFRVRYVDYDAELDARGASPELAHEASALKSRISGSMRAALAAIPADGGRIRECRYALLHFEQRMPELHDPAIAREMPEFREKARQCATRMQELVASVEPRAQELDTALADGDAFIARVPRAASAAAPAAQPAETKPAPATEVAR